MFTNRLIKESSPYLLQHAHNPVDWYPWGDEAIKKAKEEDKPILVSIGYSACHWCHVMEKESFEDPATAAIMNRNFINIKIDREERPDLDQIYMDAVQAIAGNGGWPLNVFLTPEAKPFYGGTYFPPVNLHNRASWKSILESISTAFREKRKEIEKQAENLTHHIAKPGFGDLMKDKSEGFLPEFGQEIFKNLMHTADQRNGGFGAAPKFPQTFSIRFLLQYYYYAGLQKNSGHYSPDAQLTSTSNSLSTGKMALDHACFSLDKMIQGGIYDQLGGGFARYSTDSEWLAPHFEKMLYDNALLITAMSEAFQITSKPIYRKAIIETMDFLQREMHNKEGGFYSALDADSEGIEGEFYIWQKKDIDEVLGEDSGSFCAFFDVTETGNWEGKNILRIKDPEKALPEDKEAEWKEKLMKIREDRVRPSLDDKILSGWNALMITASCKAYAALGIEKYKSLAISTMEFLDSRMKGSDICYFYHSHKEVVEMDPGKGETGYQIERIKGNQEKINAARPNDQNLGINNQGKNRIPAFLDDYAYLTEAYIQLQEITGDTNYLLRAKALTEWVIEHFSEEDSGYFYYTHAGQDNLIVRKREVYDGAQPSGNAVMAANLLYLGTVFGRDEWKLRAAENCGGLKEVIKRYPGSFGVWATLSNALTYQLSEIVLAGSDWNSKLTGFLAKAIPNRVFQIKSVTTQDFPLLGNKPESGPAQFFLCRNYACQHPVKEVAELINLLKNS